ncbi:S8 family serine peptidase [Arthrobacter sp. UYEF3]|uniref:S8 family serine peptidase n=1 Tax=Arthrobacter sp. UYEF3 TaxID=1756365 RepID=UPI00339B8027
MTRATARHGRTASALMALALAGGSVAAALAVAPAANADATRDKEYWLAESGITKAWEVSKGANVKVAVIDSGVDGKHPDLKDVLTGGTDVSGAGAADGQKSIGAKPEHGTLVATMLAGRGHQPASPSPSASGSPSPSASGSPSASPSPGGSPSGSASPGASASPGQGPGPDGIVGVAPEAQLLSVSTWLGSANPGGKSDQDQIPAAVRWAVDNGARVINISLGSTSPEWPQSWDAAFLYAEQKDVVIVAAAGNRVGGNVQVGAPATIPGVLTVAGLDRKGVASIDSSSQGISIGVAAPAESLAGGLPGGGYAEWAGTSGATPIVAGVAALIRSKWPDMSASQVINRIVSTAKDAGARGKDPLYGFGVLDAEAALKADVPESTANPLGSISDWIRVHRRGNPVSSEPAALPSPSSAAPTLPEATVPVAKAPSPADSAVPAMVVLGFGALFVCIIAAAALQLRSAVRGTGTGTGPGNTGPDNTESAAPDAVDSHTPGS